MPHATCLCPKRAACGPTGSTQLNSHATYYIPRIDYYMSRTTYCLPPIQLPRTPYTTYGIQYFMLAQTDWSTIGIPWFQNVVSEIDVRILEICKLRCFTWWQSLGETHLALEPGGWKAWTFILPMANSNTIFLPLASLRQLAWHCSKHRSLVPILHRLRVLYPTMIFLFTFSFAICIYSVFLRFTSCALNGPPLGIRDQCQ